jgi:hypothetical protein
MLLFIMFFRLTPYLGSADDTLHKKTLFAFPLATTVLI